MGWKVEFAESSERELARLPAKVKIKALEEIQLLRSDPTRRGVKKLGGHDYYTSGSLATVTASFSASSPTNVSFWSHECAIEATPIVDCEKPALHFFSAVRCTPAAHER
jgi:hypothetical protein